MTKWPGKSISWITLAFIVYVMLAVVIRFWNFKEAAYFIYDVGRDVIVLREMVGGDLKLIGATTGLPGVFLGPLWYYAGVVGYMLTLGNPYGIQIWYVALSTLAIPLFWWLSFKLFKRPGWAILSAVVLAFIPGSITGTNFVWNPMLSVPLMAGSLLCLIRSRESKKFLYAGFFLLALTLQSEFAYAVFFVTSLWILIPWLRGKFEWKTMLVTAGVIGVTLIPQGLFEVTHGFSMTKSLLSGANQSGTTVPQSYLWEHRPEQLLQATKIFFTRSDVYVDWYAYGLIGFYLLAILSILTQRNFPWKLTLLMAVLPYGFYMFWRGNYGYFFDYYITPHFIFLALLLTYGCYQFVILFRSKIYTLIATILVAAFVGMMGYHSYMHLDAVILRPVNNAGLKAMERAVQQLYDWSFADGATQAVFRIYTPNFATDSYDYLVWWLSKTKGYPHPSTVQTEDDVYRYVMYEPDEQIREKRFLPWYADATRGMTMTRQDKVGVLTLETWTQGGK